jgi:hypothetical protein
MRVRAAQILRYIFRCLDFVHCFITTAVSFPRSKAGVGSARGCALSSDMSGPLQKAIGVMRRASLAAALAMSVAGPVMRKAWPHLTDWQDNGRVPAKSNYPMARMSRSSAVQLMMYLATKANFSSTYAVPATALILICAPAPTTRRALSPATGASRPETSLARSGRADGDRFQVVARASSFVATLIVITHGGRQSVVIRSHDAQASIKGASISLKRS